MAENLVSDFFDDGPTSQEKSYTLTLICDPEDSGLDEKFKNYKLWLKEKEEVPSKPKRLVINAN